MGPEEDVPVVKLRNNWTMACSRDGSLSWCTHRQMFLRDRLDRTWFWDRMRDKLAPDQDKLCRIPVPLLPSQALYPEVDLRPVPAGVDAGLKVLVADRAQGEIVADTVIGILAPDVDSILSIRDLLVDWIRDQSEAGDTKLIACPAAFHQSREARLAEANALTLGNMAVFEYNTRVLLYGACAACVMIAESVGVSIDEVDSALDRRDSGLVKVERGGRPFGRTASGGITSSGRSLHASGRSFDTVSMDLGISTEGLAKAIGEFGKAMSRTARMAGKTAALEAAAKELLDKKKEEAEIEGLKAGPAVSRRPEPTKIIYTHNGEIADDLPF